MSIPLFGWLFSKKKAASIDAPTWKPTPEVKALHDKHMGYVKKMEVGPISNGIHPHDKPYQRKTAMDVRREQQENRYQDDPFNEGVRSISYAFPDSAPSFGSGSYDSTPSCDTSSSSSSDSGSCSSGGGDF